MATCPECDAELEIDADDVEEMEIGDPWDCDSCGSRLRVATLDPLEFESEEDDDDDDEEKGASEDGKEEGDDLDDDFDDDDDDKDSDDGGSGGWDE
jgi:alpha-aminoadipate/glutamate carrier protein LysW